jgi:hypothetical protein
MGNTKAGILIHVDRRLIDSTRDIVAIVRKDFESHKRNLLIKESVRVLKWNMQHGLNGDDFIKNMYSVVFTGKSYKVPRIIKKMLLK